MPTYAERVIADGASNYWRLGEPSGTTAADAIGGAPGTISGGVTLGQPGALTDGDRAMTFDGATGKIATVASVPVPLVCTIEGWLQWSAAFALKAIFSTRAVAGTAGDTVWFEVNGNNVQIVTASATAFGSSGRVTAGPWHHVVGVLDGASAAFYIDGVFDRTVAFIRTTPSTGPCNLGFAPGHNALTGTLDDVAIYPRALTAAEIAAHYLDGTGARSYPLTVVADGAVAYWRLNETAGTTAADQLGANPGTIAGGVTLNEPGPIAGGKAMRFDGVSGKVTVPLGAYSDFDVGALTVELWIKLEALPSSMRYFLDTADALGGVGGGLFSRFDPTSWVWTLKEATQAPATFSLPIGEWQGSGLGRWRHLVYVLQRTPTVSQFAWIDGRQVFSRTGTLGASNDLTSTHLTAIGSTSRSTLFFEGWIAEVAFYKTALTAEQIAAHVALGAAGPTTTLPLGWASFGVMEEDLMQAYNQGGAVTPSDTVDLPRLTQALWVGGAGNVAAVLQNSATVTLTAVPAGAWLPLAVRRVNATNTTATAIVALYQT